MARIPVDYNFKDIRNSYFAHKKPKNITYTQYTEYVKDLNKLLVQWVIDGKILPTPIGYFYVVKYKIEQRTKETPDGVIPISGRLVNYGETMKLRKQLQPTWTHEDWKKLPLAKRAFVMFDNSHTENFIYSIRWSKWGHSKNAQMQMYAFRPNIVDFRKKLSHRLLTDKLTKPAYYDKYEIRKMRQHYRESQEGFTTRS
jgi:hypothetical protein